MIDLCIRHTWSSQEELVDRLDPAWREFLGRRSRGPAEAKPVQLFPQPPFTNPFGDKRAEAAAGAPAGSSYETVRDQHLDRFGVEAALPCPDRGPLISAMG